MKLTEFESNLKNNIAILHDKIDLIGDRLLGPQIRKDKGNTDVPHSHQAIMTYSIDELKECHEDLRPSFLAFCFDTPTGDQSEPADMPPMVDMNYVACSVLLGIRTDLRHLCDNLGVVLKDEDIESKDNSTTYSEACCNILVVLQECINACIDILEFIGTDEEVSSDEN